MAQRQPAGPEPIDQAQGDLAGRAEARPGVCGRWGGHGASDEMMGQARGWEAGAAESNSIMRTNEVVRGGQ